MIQMRSRRCESWLDAQTAKTLSAKLSDRLTARCAGQQGLMLTLTYRRDEYDSPRDLYRAASEERHVRRFIEQLSAFLGRSLTGRWICKLEFQRGGWVHWHIILLGVTHIDHVAATDIWGHGYVWLNRLTPKRVRYLCKYVSKDAQLPAFLLAEPLRSVKIIRVSPGFWHDTEPSPPYDPPPPMQKLEGCFVPIGMALDKAANTTVVRDPDTGRYTQVHQPFWQMLHELIDAGASIVACAHGWLEVRGPTIDDINADRRGKRPGLSHPSRTGGEAARREAAVHLIRTGNPPTPRTWLDVYLEGELGWTQCAYAGGV